MSAVAGRCPTHIGGLSDDELVQLARGGSEPAFDAIVNRYRAPLYSYSRRWLDPHRAEEVVQHTLMKAFVCLRDDDRPLALRPWLYRVAHNAALNAIEKKGSEWEELDENYDGVPQPPQVAEQRARFLQIVDGIGALPQRQRDALLLNEFEGRCYADIATQLGTSESGVRGLLRRARRQLRDTAALLLPFPALREFVRSNAGRTQVDGAGEMIGSAGAVGGAGVAGGLTKIAAGVLAAGTIAGGGTAIERHRDSLRAGPAEAAEAAAPQAIERTAASGEARAVPAAPTGGLPAVVPLITFSGGGLVGAGFDAAGGAEGVALEEIEAPADPDPAPPAAESAPLVPASPGLTTDDPSGEEPAEDEPAEDDPKAEDPKTSDTKESGSKDPPADDDDASTSDTTDADAEPQQGPAAVPATPLQQPKTSR